MSRTAHPFPICPLPHRAFSQRSPLMLFAILTCSFSALTCWFLRLGQAQDLLLVDQHHDIFNVLSWESRGWLQRSPPPRSRSKGKARKILTPPSSSTFEQGRIRSSWTPLLPQNNSGGGKGEVGEVGGGGAGGRGCEFGGVGGGGTWMC